MPSCTKVKERGKNVRSSLLRWGGIWEKEVVVFDRKKKELKYVYPRRGIFSERKKIVLNISQKNDDLPRTGPIGKSKRRKGRAWPTSEGGKGN